MSVEMIDVASGPMCGVANHLDVRRGEPPDMRRGDRPDERRE